MVSEQKAEIASGWLLAEIDGELRAPHDFYL